MEYCFWETFFPFVLIIHGNHILENKKITFLTKQVRYNNFFFLDIIHNMNTFLFISAPIFSTAFGWMLSFILLYPQPKSNISVILKQVKRNPLSIIKSHLKDKTALEPLPRDRTLLGHDQHTMVSSWQKATGTLYWVLFLISVSNSISLVGQDLSLRQLYSIVERTR